MYMCVYLQYGHFIPQLALLLGGKAKLVNNFNSYVPACLPVLSWRRNEVLVTDVVQKKEPHMYVAIYWALLSRVCDVLKIVAHWLNIVLL